MKKLIFWILFLTTTTIYGAAGDYIATFKQDYSTITKQTDFYMVGKLGIGTSTSTPKISISSQAYISVGNGIKEIQIATNTYTIGYSSASAFFGDGTGITGVTGTIDSLCRMSTGAIQLQVNSIMISTGMNYSAIQSTYNYLYEQIKSTNTALTNAVNGKQAELSTTTWKAVNSDKLDGYDYTTFMDTYTAQTISGQKTFTGYVNFNSSISVIAPTTVPYIVTFGTLPAGHSVAISTSGYTQLGEYDTGTKRIVISTVTASVEGGNTMALFAPYGINSTKITSITCLVAPAAVQGVLPNFPAKFDAGWEYGFRFNNLGAYIFLDATNSEGILNKPVTIQVEYRE